MDRKYFDLDAELEAAGMVWDVVLGAWVPERMVVAGVALGSDEAKQALGWERVEGGWIVARRPAGGPVRRGGRP